MVFKKKNLGMKVLLIIDNPFSERAYNFYGIQCYKSNDIEIRIIDVTKIVYKNFNTVNSYFEFKCEELTIVSKISEFNNYLIEEKFDFVYNTLNLNFHTKDIFSSISKFKIRYCVNPISVVPTIPNKTKLFLFNRFSKVSFPRLYNLFLRIFPLNFFGIKYADFVITHGKLTSFNKVEIGRKTENIKLHTYDYDIFLETNKDLKHDNINETNGKIVFLDQYLPYHPDFHLFENRNLSEMPTDINDSLYYDALNNFFDRIESITGKKVVIAAHPKSEYEKIGNKFNGREIIKNKTCELIFQSNLVLLDQSTSLNYAVLFKKPVVFIYTSETSSQFLGKLTENLASMFNKVPINVSEEFDLNVEEMFELNHILYEKYKEDYIKQRSSEENYSWNIFINRIKKMN